MDTASKETRKKSFNSKKKKLHPNARNSLDFVWKIIIRYCTYYPDNNLPLEMNQKNIKVRKIERKRGKKSSYYMGFWGDDINKMQPTIKWVLEI